MPSWRDTPRCIFLKWKMLFFSLLSVVFPRNSPSCCYVNSTARLSVRICWVTSIQICSLMLLQYLNSVFLMRILKKADRERKKREDRDHDGFNSLGFSWQVFVWFCCFCNGNAYLLSYFTIYLPLVQKVLVIPHWVRIVANEVHRKTLQYKASERMSKSTCILTILYPKCCN